METAEFAVPNMETAEFAVNRFENEPPHLGLHCLPSSLWILHVVLVFCFLRDLIKDLPDKI